jgi:predicted PurR-regulated permease PerM
MDVNAKTLGQWALLGSFAVILYYCFRIMEPFLMPIFLALILSTLLAPLYDSLIKRFRLRPTTSAMLVCLILTLAIVLPVLMLSVSLATEAASVYSNLQDPATSEKIQLWLNPNSSPILQKIESWLPASMHFRDFDIGEKIGAKAQEIIGSMLVFTAALASEAFNFLANYVTMVVVLFFLLRDSKYFAEGVREVSPLSDFEENLFVDRFRTVARATVIGTLATSAAQGLMSGIIFLALGLSNPILWGSLTALMSLVPMAGTALVWIPWTIYLFATGSPIKAIIFLVLQVVAVGGADNILRPLLMEGKMKMHTLVIFFSLLGGITYFGILGIFIGPLVFAIAIAFMEFYGSHDKPPELPADEKAASAAG